MTIQELACDSSNFTPARSAAVRYVVVHYTGNKGDTAKNNADYFANNSGLEASAHYFVDENEIWRSVPEEDTAWHCGSKAYVHPECRNANSIGVEVCMWDKQGNVRQGSIDRAALLVRELMEKYDIDVEHVVRHYDVTGKKCPAPMVEDETLWSGFLAALGEEDEDMPNISELTGEQVSALWEKLMEPLRDNDAATWSEEARQWAVDNGLIVGDGSAQPNYQWQAPLTREAMCVLLYRFAQMIGKA